jgi:hypothetical protein
MTREDMIRLAHEAGWKYADGDDSYAPLWEFGKLVAAAGAATEREECAKVCDDMSGPIEIYNPAYIHYIGCAEAIRARGQS